MKHTIRIVLILVFGMTLLTPVFAGGMEDSLYTRVSRAVMHKLALRQQENEALRQRGLPGNYVVYVTDDDVAQDAGFPPNVLSLLQKNTKQSDVEKLWDFTGNPYLKRLPQKLQDFSKKEGYDYYVVVCAIYNYFRLDESTDFTNITWTNSDLLKSNKGASEVKTVNTDQKNGNGGYRNLLRHLVKKFDTDLNIEKSKNKSNVYHFVMSAYIPDENATDSRPVGMLRHFQGFYWTSPNGDTAFDKLWTTFLRGFKAELAGMDNEQQMNATKEEWLEGFVMANQEILAGIRKAHPEELANIKDKMKLLDKLKEIPENVYGGFSAKLRIQMLQILSADNGMHEEAEQKSCALIEQAPVSQADEVIKAMQEANPFVPRERYSSSPQHDAELSAGSNNQYGWCLLKCLTEKTNDAIAGMIGGDNYQRLIKAITILCYKSNGFKDKAQKLNDEYLNVEEGKLPDRVIFYTYNSFWSKVASTFFYGRYVGPKIDLSTSYDGCELQTKKELFFSYVIPNGDLQNIKLDPFEPIVFENKTDLGLLAGMNENGTDETTAQDHIVPAILLKYANDKGTNETLTDGAMAAIDAASMLTGYGEIKAGVAGIRKAWVLFDMINSGINIAGNLISYDNPNLKAVMTYYNMATGAIALGRMGAGAIKSVKDAYKALKAQRTAMNATSIRDFVKSIKTAGDDLVELHPDDAARVKAYLQRLKAEAKARGLNTFEQNVDDAIAAVNAGGKVISEAIASNKIFKQLSSLPDVALDKGLSLIHRKTKSLIAHWTKGGKTMYLDAAENVSSDGKLIDIIEGESYVPRGGTTAVNDDLMIMQGADNTVYCVRGACFVAGTNVHTRGGIKPIELVQDMEEVLSLDEQTGKSGWEKVAKTFRRTASRLVRLVTGKDTLWSTPEHPYLTDNGWKMASAIQPGRKLRLAGGLFAAALSTASFDTTVAVYNFEVARTHNYCIGSEGIVVHNSCAILNKLRKQIDPDLADNFVKDFSGDANMLSKFDNGEYSTHAWEAMHSRPDLRKSQALLKNVTEALGSKSLERLGVDKAVIDKIARALKNDYGTYGDIVKALDNEMFITLNNFRKFLDKYPQTKLVNFEKIVSDLINSGFPNRKGSHWVLKGMANDTENFANKNIEFNAWQKINGGDYYPDVTVTGGDKPQYFEFKSGPYTMEKEVEFIREFVNRDLRLQDLTDLSQLHWKRDVGMDGIKKRIMGWLKTDEGKKALNDNKIIDMFSDFAQKVGYDKRVNNVDKLLTFMEDNDDWFDMIFNGKKIPD